MMNKVAKKIYNRTSLEHIGWYGAACSLAAYFLISTSLVSGQSLVYQTLNINGALCFAYYAYRRKVYPSVLVNSIWLLIGLATIAMLYASNR